jgi:hypothetical protein
VNRRDDHDGRHSRVEVRAAWRSGVRTPAWGALWRQIFADLEGTLNQPALDDEADVTSPPSPTAEPIQGEV